MSAIKAAADFAVEAAAIHKHIAAGEQEFRLAARELISVRDRLRHGQWLPWLKASGINERTARRLIDEFHHPDKAYDRRAKQAVRNESLKSATSDRFADNIVEFPEPSEPAGDDRPNAVRDFEEGPVAWVNRAASAKNMAAYAPLETCPTSRKMLVAAKEVVAAWNTIIKHIETEIHHGKAS